jgi:hypothetical protein
MNTVFIPSNTIISERKTVFDTGETQCSHIFFQDFNHYNPFLTEMEHETHFVGSDQKDLSSQPTDDHSFEAHAELCNSLPLFDGPYNKKAKIEVGENPSPWLDEQDWLFLQYPKNLEQSQRYSVVPLHTPYRPSFEHMYNPFELEDNSNCARNLPNPIGKVDNTTLMTRLSQFKSQNQGDIVFLKSINSLKKVYIDRRKVNISSVCRQTDFSLIRKQSLVEILKSERSLDTGSTKIDSEEDRSSFFSPRNDTGERINIYTRQIDIKNSVLRLESEQYSCSDTLKGFRALTGIIRREAKVNRLPNSANANDLPVCNVLKIEPPKTYLDFVKVIAPKPKIDKKEKTKPPRKKKIRHNFGSKTSLSGKDKPDDSLLIPKKVVKKSKSNCKRASILDIGKFNRHFEPRSIRSGRRLYIDFIESSNKSATEI